MDDGDLRQSSWPATHLLAADWNPQSRWRETLAIAVLGEDGASAGLGQVGLIPYGRYQGGVPVGLADPPRWNAETWGQPRISSNFAVGLTADHQIVFGGETLMALEFWSRLTPPTSETFSGIVATTLSSVVSITEILATKSEALPKA
jgi:hypothetical protein